MHPFNLIFIYFWLFLVYSGCFSLPIATDSPTMLTIQSFITRQIQFSAASQKQMCRDQQTRFLLADETDKECKLVNWQLSSLVLLYR